MITVSPSQRGVLKGIIAGASLSVGMLGFAIIWGPDALIPDDQSIHRIGFALRWDLALQLSIKRGSERPTKVTAVPLQQCTSSTHSYLSRTVEVACLTALLDAPKVVRWCSGDELNTSIRPSANVWRNNSSSWIGFNCQKKNFEPNLGWV